MSLPEMDTVAIEEAQTFICNMLKVKDVTYSDFDGILQAQPTGFSTLLDTLGSPRGFAVILSNLRETQIVQSSNGVA